ncbi:hypothetical protein, partial [Xanthobacter versatilis]|uniref:hypothetical protein n=1 Tax=Xanthobacter autotrophicus (strain ATCC BAA-1158 / Py2) TaxID=78245 RepID=UPI00372A0A6A
MTADIIDPAALAKRVELALRYIAECYGDMTAMELRVTAPEARALAALLRGVVDGPKVKPLEWHKSKIAGWNDDWH